MDTRLFGLTGYSYFLACFLGSTTGAIIFMMKLTDNIKCCELKSCDCASGSNFSYASSAMLFVLSASFVSFLKIGIDRGKSVFIRISRGFMLIRNFILTACWTLESVALIIAQVKDGGDCDDETKCRRQVVATVLLVGTGAITGLELWIHDGVERFIEQRLYASSDTESIGSRT